MHPGDGTSLDQFVCHAPSRLPHAHGKEHFDDHYHGGIMFVNHASGFIFLHNQISLRIGKTLQGKHEHEKFAAQCGIKLKSFHANNHPFGTLKFINDLELQDQSIMFRGVRAHHQNGITEHAFKTVTSESMPESPGTQ